MERNRVPGIDAAVPMQPTCYILSQRRFRGIRIPFLTVVVLVILLLLPSNPKNRDLCEAFHLRLVPSTTWTTTIRQPIPIGSIATRTMAASCSSSPTNPGYALIHTDSSRTTTTSTTTWMSTVEDGIANVNNPWIFPLWPTTVVTTTAGMDTTTDRNGFSTDITSSKQSKKEEDTKIPFIIERLSVKPSSRVYQEIAEMCITAFFNTDSSNYYNNNDNNSGRTNAKHSKLRSPSTSSMIIPFWKEWQLAYLRT
jgi:hypothetical protein